MPLVSFRRCNIIKGPFLVSNFTLSCLTRSIRRGGNFWKTSSPLPKNHQFRVFLPSNNSRSEDHTSELQSQSNLVCRLLLEKKNLFIIIQLHLIKLIYILK